MSCSGFGQLQIEKLEQRNQRLQASGEVTEKAAAEFVDQKSHEVSFLQNELATQLAGMTHLSVFQGRLARWHLCSSGRAFPYRDFYLYI